MIELCPHRKLCAGISSKAGFTLIETLIAMGILTLVLLGWMSVMLQSFRLVQETDDRISAINEAQTVLNLLRISSTDPALFPGEVVAAYPAGELSPARTELSGEVVTVSYVDSTANPLSVTITVDYVNNNGRAQTEILSTLLSNF